MLKKNISTQFLADIETGKKGMSVFTLKNVCSALGTTADYIIYGLERNTEKETGQLLCNLNDEQKEKIKNIIREITKILT